MYVCPWLLSHVRLLATLCSVPQAPLSMGFSRQEYWSGLLCPPPGNLLFPWIKLMSLALQMDSLPLSHQRNPLLDMFLVNTK